MNAKKIGLLSIVILSASLMPVAFAEKAITMELFDTEYNTSDTLLILGNVDTKKTSTPVTLTVYDPSDTIVYKPNVPLDENGEFKWLLKPTLPAFEQGMYTIEATHKDIETTTIATFHVGETGSLESITTQEVPEFGALAMIVLSVSIIAIIVTSAKMKVMTILGN
jgi:predicted secreted protein with PEFG-CTERM motif